MNEYPTKYKTASGQRRTRSLFLETILFRTDKKFVLYTLKNEDYQGYPSLYRLYLEENDPTEWKFASKYMESFDHWTMLCESTFFKPHIAKWRRDLELKIKSDSLSRLMEKAKEDGAPFQVNKFLLEKGWLDKKEKGRPTKEDIKREAKRKFEENTTLKEHAERLGINLNNG